VADEIMHLHGGDLFIDSILGEGTKVTILMPKEKQS
jgi:signal transduction histidine kinase